MMAKVKRPEHELPESLIEQMRFLKKSSKEFDLGDLSEAKRLATTIRVLVYDNGKNNVSLLKQLKAKATGFINTSEPYDPLNLVSLTGLTSLSLSNEHASFIAKLESGLNSRPKIKLFEQWWNDPVISDATKRKFSRRELILFTSNWEGGAHFDESIGQDWANLTRNCSVGWVLNTPKGTMKITGIEKHSVRQIAFEVDLTIRRWAEKSGFDLCGV